MTTKTAFSRLLAAVTIACSTALSLETTRAAEVGPPKVGEILEVKDTGGIWYKSTVLKIDGDKRFIHYEGWSDNWNEWVTPDRVRVFAPPNIPTTLGVPVVGEMLDAKDKNGGWYKATVLKVEGDKRFIHYDGYSDSWDEWLGADHVKARGSAAPGGVGTGATAAPKNVERPKKLTYPTTLGTPTIGEVLHARDRQGQWYLATVLQADGDKRFVHFQGWADSNNEWVAADAVKPLTAPEAAAASTRRKLDGWFAKTEIVFFGGAHMKSTHYWFRPDGNVYFGTPPAGLGDDDFAALKKSDPTNCGTYELVGQALTLRKNGGEPEDHTYSPGAGGVMDSNPLSRVYRFKPGSRLEGTWGVNISSNFGGVAAFGAQSWNFHKDGTFEHTTSGGVETTETKGTGGAAPGQAVAQSAAITRGTYDFGGGKLILTAADGRTESHSASATDSMEKPRILNIDGSDLNQTR